MKTIGALAQFLAVTGGVSGAESSVVTDLFTDSREVIPGSAFVAVQGTKKHGMDFAQKAIDQGAVCILTDRPGDYDAWSIPVWVSPTLPQQLSGLAEWFYDAPSQKVPVIGITGTNGKTSTSHYIAQILDASGYQVALLGTLGNGFFGQLQPSANTTLEVISLNRMLRNYADAGADYVVMEVSSHAIVLERIAKMTFEVLALTQVTRDHLDFHGTESAYRQSKASLFLDYPSQWQVLNLEDSIGSDVYDRLSAKGRTIGYAKGSDQLSRTPDLSFESLEFLSNGMTGMLRWNGQRIQVQTQLMGAFNAENLLCALGVCLACGLSLELLPKAIAQLRPVSGRMEQISQSPVILIDYAHTPDALEAVLKAVQQHLQSGNARLWVVFGCGGDRDVGKRPLMGQIANHYADQVVITDDNPRFESPKQIVTQILSGIDKPEADRVQVIHDRSQAIEYAVRTAKPEDILVIAGKGHEDYQEINGQKYPMKDVDMIRQAMQNRMAAESSQEES
ncbi:MAG: UDP-N-acetylmuramoyl-L-alanyl-D-glutamate--2,6-diaminopimelate ligase [Hydrogenovibrio sp.]|nr:UDP-N-acetylmuramoyl-L-alanyl-D-glutamate--2,6-diaminopimelate ligase [Hydrogenovibrio sp.]